MGARHGAAQYSHLNHVFLTRSGSDVWTSPCDSIACFHPFTSRSSANLADEADFRRWETELDDDGIYCSGTFWRCDVPAGVHILDEVRVNHFPVIYRDA